MQLRNFSLDDVSELITGYRISQIEDKDRRVQCMELLSETLAGVTETLDTLLPLAIITAILR